MTSWPVVVFDDDGYLYTLADYQDLRAWAESPEALDEFTAGFDSAGQRLFLSFVDDEPQLGGYGDYDLLALRLLVKSAVGRFSRPALQYDIFSRIESMTAQDLIIFIRQSGI